MGYIKIYQFIGDNIRSSGSAFSEDFNEENIYIMPKYINKFIKLIRRREKINKGQKEEGNALIVIDAIRNPFEALFFRDRYSGFYLISINTPEKDRCDRLIKKNFTERQIEEIDQKEYPKKLKKYKIFTSQNIQKCIEMADIHLNNPQLGTEDTSLLMKQIARYLTLIIHPGLVTPTPIERCMQIAYGAKLNSGCISRQVGAVITDEDFSVKAVGWNNTPAGQTSCLLRSAESLIRNDDKKAFSDYEINDSKFLKQIKETYQDSNTLNERLKGRNSSFCFKDIQNYIDGEKNQVHTRSLHAEENAFLQITKYGGEGIKGGRLFTTASTCELCAKKAYQLGIRSIVYIDPYPGIASDHILKSGNESSRPEMILFHGAIGVAYHKLYQPLLPFKEELSMLIEIKYNQQKEQYKSLEEENESLRETIKSLTKELQTKELQLERQKQGDQQFTPEGDL